MDPDLSSVNLLRQFAFHRNSQSVANFNIFSCNAMIKPLQKANGRSWITNLSQRDLLMYKCKRVLLLRISDLMLKEAKNLFGYCLLQRSSCLQVTATNFQT